MLNTQLLQHTTPEARFSQIQWKALVIGSTCFILCIIFFIGIGNFETPWKIGEQINVEKYIFSVSPTCLNSSGEWIEVGIGTSEPLQRNARVCRTFPTVELLRCHFYPNPSPSPNSSSYCYYYCWGLF